MIHDWIGVVIIPASSIEQVLATLSNYEYYKDFYHPTVIDAQVLERSADGDLFRMYWINKVHFGRMLALLSGPRNLVLSY